MHIWFLLTVVRRPGFAEQLNRVNIPLVMVVRKTQSFFLSPAARKPGDPGYPRAR